MRNGAKEYTIGSESPQLTLPDHFDELFRRTGAKVILGLLGVSVIVLFLSLLPKSSHEPPPTAKIETPTTNSGTGSPTNLAEVAQSSLPQCPSDTEVRWTNCQGTRTSADGSKYVGEWRDGSPNGQGTLTTPNGDNYVGEIRAGKLTGQVTLTRADGSKYVGQFSNNKMSGQGTMFAPDGTMVRSGIWENNKFVTSTSVTPSGSDKVTKGPQVVVPSAADAQSGLQCPSDTNLAWTDYCQGTVTSPNGDKYVGEFRNNMPDGQGTLTWTNGSRYVGEFSHGKMNGQGTLTYADGSKYVGGFSNGEMDGQGTVVAPDGAIKKSGNWQDSKRVRSTGEPSAKIDTPSARNRVVPTVASIPSLPSDCYQTLVHSTDHCNRTLAQEAEFLARWRPDDLKAFIRREYRTAEDARRHGHNFNCTEQCDWTLEDQKLRGLSAQYEADQEKLRPMRKQQQGVDDLINTLHSMGVR
jgi:hypothetical protein